MIQAFKPTLDPFSGTTTSATSLINLYQGVLPGIVIPPTQAGTNANPPITTSLPSNYLTKIPTMGTTARTAPTSPASTSGSGYYWVCLRRPANLFAPVVSRTRWWWWIRCGSRTWTERHARR